LSAPTHIANVHTARSVRPLYNGAMVTDVIPLRAASADSRHSEQVGYATVKISNREINEMNAPTTKLNVF